MSVSKKIKSLSWKIILAFAAVYIFWGSTYFAIAVSVKEIPPFALAGFRFFVAGFLLFSYSKFNGQSHRGIREIIKISVPGVLMLFFGSGSVIWVEQYLASGLTSIIWAFLPIWFILLDYKEWSANFKNKYLLLGLLLGFVGIVVLLFDDAILNFDNPNILFNIPVAIGGTIFFAVGSLLTKYTRETHMSASIKASIQMMVAGLLAILFAFLLGETRQLVLSDISLKSLLALLYLILFGSIAAYLAYIWLLEKVPPAIVATYTYINPLVALFLGWSILNENITLKQLLVLGIILTGVIMVNLNKSKT